MARRRYPGAKSMFAKDPDALPFFSLHPKTIVGTIIRIFMCVFTLVCMLLMVLAAKGIAFQWIAYVRPLAIMVIVGCTALLILLALFKRMPSTFLKVLVPGVLLMLAISVFTALYSMVSHVCSLELAPEAAMNVNGHPLVIMRQCAQPEQKTDENGQTGYVGHIEAYKYTVRVPEAIEGVSYAIDGEILVPVSGTWNIAEEWVDEDTFHLYIDKDETGVATGEITVRFSKGETTPASEPAASDMSMRNGNKPYVSPAATHQVYLYRSQSYIEQLTDSIYLLDTQAFPRVYCVYPRTMLFFVRTDVRVDGRLELDAYVKMPDLRVTMNESENVIKIEPAEETEGVRGSITVYLNEKASALSATPDEATPGEATPNEAAPATAGQAE